MPWAFSCRRNDLVKIAFLTEYRSTLHETRSDVPKRPMILTTRPILCLRPKLGGSNRWNVSLLTDFDMLCKTHMQSQLWKTPLRQLNTISLCTKLHPVLLRSTSKPMELVPGPKSLSQILNSLSSIWWKIYSNFYYLNYLYFNKFS